MAKEKIEGKAGKVVTNCDQLSETIDIQPMIKVIRGQQVMLDSDLSALYGVETRRLNEQVKRNKERFPDDFMFQLRKEELDNLMSQNATSSWGGTRKLPYAFTEQGLAHGVLHDYHQGMAQRHGEYYDFMICGYYLYFTSH